MAFKSSGSPNLTASDDGSRASLSGLAGFLTRRNRSVQFRFFRVSSFNSCSGELGSPVVILDPALPAGASVSELRFLGLGQASCGLHLTFDSSDDIHRSVFVWEEVKLHGFAQLLRQFGDLQCLIELPRVPIAPSPG